MKSTGSQHVGISLKELKNGMCGIEPARGETFAHAASVCLEDRKHVTGVLMHVGGSMKRKFKRKLPVKLPVFWESIDEQVRRSWADLEEATEHGAYGIAALLIVRLTDLTVVQRAKKGKGFDYWLGPKNGDQVLFQDTARLEVSGILDGDKYDIEQRVKEKCIQVKQGLPGFVVIVEFGRPEARMVTK